MKHTIDLQPFSVPNYVRQVSPIGKREDGWKETPEIPLSELSAETLEAMCAQFRGAVFEKAGKMPPNTNNASQEVSEPRVRPIF